MFLSGTGTQPAVSMTTPALFPSTTVGATTADKTVTISNSGTAPLVVDAVTTVGPNAGDFTSTDNCFGTTPTSITLPPGGSCDATVSFAPSAPGSRKALLQVTDNAPGGTHSVPLSGSGVAAPATVPGAPVVGTATAGNGSAALTWTAPTATGGSAITGYTLNAVSAAGTVVTGSAAAGATSGTVAGLVNGTSYTLKVAAVNAVGTGGFSSASNPVTPAAPPAPKAVLSPASVTFPSTTVGASSAAQTVTLTNSGTASMDHHQCRRRR